ncbi:MAG: ICEBs1 excisionase [Butyrivibrio sp.]|nr:ICEBs1 excisionase [Butyrivibrio sp.]
MNEKLYYTAAEIAQMIGVGRTTAYGIVKQMNEELKSRGFLAVRGKVPKEFFDAKYFGGTRCKGVSA